MLITETIITNDIKYVHKKWFGENKAEIKPVKRSNISNDIKTTTKTPILTHTHKRV